tara:strand:+ start:28 stop:504 length:477 start_codon:yes stop_codon:yes gene_type:complete
MIKKFSYLFIILFFISGCKADEDLIDIFEPKFELTSFDVVQKKLVVEKELPNHVQLLITKWFDEKVKVDGFDGNMKFTITNYKEETSSLSDGKRVDVSLSFQVVLKKPSLSQTKIVEGEVSSYGTLTGDLTLNEFDRVIKNTQRNLILILSRDLKNKI